MVVASSLGVKATVFYLAVYLFMNMAAFAVILARERETDLGDSIAAVTGLGRQRPLLAWPLTIAMLGLAGIPATAGFIGKFYLIDATVSGGYAWLGVVIVVGSMISLGYYLPVIAAMWMREAPAPPARASPAASGAGAARPGRAAGARGRLAGARRGAQRGPRARAEPQPEVLLVALRVRGGDDLLRRDPPAPVRARQPRRRNARAALTPGAGCGASGRPAGRACGRYSAPGVAGGLLGLLELALDEVQARVPEAGVGEVHADDPPELLGRCASRPRRAAPGSSAPSPRRAARSARTPTAPAAGRRRTRTRSRAWR